MTPSRVCLLATSIALCSCTSMPPLGTRSATIGPDVSAGLGEALETKVVIDGRLLVPQHLISNHANALVGNNANALVGNNANALVGNNANAFRVQALDQKPWEGAQVRSVNENGQEISDQFVSTDKDGRFRLKSKKGVVFLEATAGKLKELAIVHATSPTNETKIDSATSLVASQLKASGTRLSAFAREELAALENLVASQVDNKAAESLIKDEGDQRSNFDRLALSDPSLKFLFDKILAGVPKSTGSTGGASGSGGSVSASTGAALPMNKTAPTTSRVASKITPASWPTVGRQIKFRPGGSDSFDVLEAARQEGSPVFVAHNSPNIKAGDTVSFNLVATSASQTDERELAPAYVKFYDLAGSVLAVAKVYMSRGPDSLLACKSKSESTLSCRSLEGEYGQFKFTLDKDVGKIEFGGETSIFTALLTEIDINQ